MKRFFDVVIAFILLVCLSPLILVISLLIKMKLGSPVFFKQIRPGLHEKPFYLYKFRSMTNEKDENGHLKLDEERLTAFGMFLRKYSLDELPQLINVLKGDMSLVGPRPLLMEYLPFYTKEQRKRFLVKPGITGWAQINGRNRLNWEEKFALDVWYVDNRTFLLDVKIILLTLIEVLKTDRVHEEGHATARKFTENLQMNKNNE